MAAKNQLYNVEGIPQNQPGSKAKKKRCRLSLTRGQKTKDFESAGVDVVLGMKIRLPEDKRRCFVIQGNMFFCTARGLKIPFDLFAAQTCE
jgi:hypothetical protein